MAHTNVTEKHLFGLRLKREREKKPYKNKQRNQLLRKKKPRIKSENIHRKRANENYLRFVCNNIFSPELQFQANRAINLIYKPNYWPTFAITVNVNSFDFLFFFFFFFFVVVIVTVAVVVGAIVVQFQIYSNNETRITNK